MLERENEKIRQRDEKRAKTAAILSRRRIKKLKQREQQKEIQRRKNLIQLEEDYLNDDMFESRVPIQLLGPKKQIIRFIRQSPIQQRSSKKILPLNSSPTSLYNLYDGEPNISSSNLPPGPTPCWIVPMYRPHQLSEANLI